MNQLVLFYFYFLRIIKKSTKHNHTEILMQILVYPLKSIVISKLDSFLQKQTTTDELENENIELKGRSIESLRIFLLVSDIYETFLLSLQLIKRR